MLPNETSEICRLCLVKEHVNISIFENDSEQLFYKISSCLPITINADDELPKKICANCCDKVNSVFEFWNQTLHAQKYLLTWLNDETKCEFEGKYIERKSHFEKEEDNYRKSRNCESNGQKNDTFSSNSSPDFWCSNKEEDDDYDGTSPFDDDCVQLESESVQTQSVTFDDAASSALKRLQGYTEELSNNSLSNLSRIFEVLNSPGEVVDEMNLMTETLYRHCEDEESSFSLRCDKCCKSFSCNNVLAMHKLSPCNETSNAETHNDTDTLSARPESYRNKVIRCRICDMSFKTDYQLRMHRSTHKDTKPFACGKCGTAFRYKKTYETHVKMHENEKPSLDERPFVCDVCEQRFATRNSYIHHARSHKNDSIEAATFACVVCRKMFATERMLAIHRRVQCGEKTFACEVCGKKLSTQESLECHKLIHAGDKPLVCQVCRKTFSQRKYFIVHQRIHTGERPYKCETCAKTFTQASALTVHRRYHTGERPYKCDICSKGFVTRTIMLSHLKYHKNSPDAEGI